MWNHTKNSMKRLKRATLVFLQGEVSYVWSSLLKTWKTGETKIQITQNFEKLWPIEGGIMWKLMSRAFRKCGSFWDLRSWCTLAVRFPKVENGKGTEGDLDIVTSPFLTFSGWWEPKYLSFSSRNGGIITWEVCTLHCTVWAILSKWLILWAVWAVWAVLQARLAHIRRELIAGWKGDISTLWW